MENTTTGFLEEAPGHKSNMRLMSLLLLFFFIAYHLIFIWANAKRILAGMPLEQFSDTQLWFDVIVLAFVFIPKAAQKVIESKFSTYNQKP